MNANEAVAAIYNGDLVVCTADEWPELRRVIQEQAGKWIDQGQGIRAQIALEEVRRLDARHGCPLIKWEAEG